MNDPKSYNRVLSRLSSDYFHHLGSAFPVMCASDEFHFVPRVMSASSRYDRLDSLGLEEIESCISTLKDFRNKLESVEPDDQDIDSCIDLELLKNSIAGILIELERKETWKYNPLLYLKIAFIGLDHALLKPASGEDEIIERTLARLNSVPRLLRQAAANLQRVSTTRHQASLMMLSDCFEYLEEIKKKNHKTNLKRLLHGLEKSHKALVEFREFLRLIPTVPDDYFAASLLEETLRSHFGCTRELREVLEVGRSEWEEALAGLNKLQARIDTHKTWQRIYDGYFPEDVKSLDTLSLYSRETERLRCFFRNCGFRKLVPESSPEVVETPTYLRSVRSSASFSAAFSDDIREKSFFYITTKVEDRMGKDIQELLRRRLHREYRFLTAHETFPGHHVLDDNRRRIPNPIRSQIESPLFYEGWAYYVESLLTEYGYVDNPMDEIVDARRRLWRAARCWIDVGTNTGDLSNEAAADLLIKTGCRKEEAGRQLVRFRLNPGYQMCYSLGRYEIMRLRERYGTRMGQDRFHKELLTGGQLPFHLIEKRFKGLLGNKNDTI